MSGCSVPRRVRLSAPRRPFRPSPDAVQRVSLAWWEHGDPEPVIEDTHDGPTTVVVRWPTGSDGRIDLEAVRRGEIEVTSWTLSRDALDALAGVHRRFPLEEHDVRVSLDGGRVRATPCPRCLRAMAGDLGLSDLLERGVRRVLESLEGAP